MLTPETPRRGDEGLISSPYARQAKALSVAYQSQKALHLQASYKTTVGDDALWMRSFGESDPSAGVDHTSNSPECCPISGIAAVAFSTRATWATIAGWNSVRLFAPHLAGRVRYCLLEGRGNSPQARRQMIGRTWITGLHQQSPVHHEELRR